VDDPVEVKRESAVLTVTINRAERRNALNEAVARGIAAGLDRAEADRSVRVVVLTGAGKDAFCAGGDMRPAADGAPFTIDPADPRHYVADLLRRMDACRLPLIARLNGHALMDFPLPVPASWLHPGGLREEWTETLPVQPSLDMALR
jgi:enoyl-CoA hydratase/carnithine racemase